MKGMRKYLAVMMAVIMALAMVACDSEQDSRPEENTSSHSNRDDDENEVEVEDPEPDEKPEVTKPEDPEPEVVEPETEPEPVVEDDPNIIEGVDFTAFNEDGNRETLAGIMNTMKLDGLRLIALKLSDAAGHEVVDEMLADGATYNVAPDKLFYYVFLLYQPGKIENIAVDETNIFCSHGVFYDYVYGGAYLFSISNPDIITADGYDMTVTATYSDGTEETITVTLVAE